MMSSLSGREDSLEFETAFGDTEVNSVKEQFSVEGYSILFLLIDRFVSRMEEKSKRQCIELNNKAIKSRIDKEISCIINGVISFCFCLILW